MPAHCVETPRKASRTLSMMDAVHKAQLAKGMRFQVRRMQYVRPKPPTETSAKLNLVAHRQNEAQHESYLFDKAFSETNDELYFGLRKRERTWYFDVKRNGHLSYHPLRRLKSIRFFRSDCIELKRNTGEYLYVYFFGPNQLTYMAFYNAVQFLILRGSLPALTLKPWLVQGNLTNTASPSTLTG